MKTLIEYINDTLNESVFDKNLIEKNNINNKPSSKQELVDSISKYISLIKTKRNDTIDLNWLDTSNIKDFANIFDARGNRNYRDWNFDVSEWDVSNGENFTGMFIDCKKFNCDLSKWDMKKATHIGYMFQGCSSFIGGGLDNWDISGKCFITGMFKKSGVSEDNLPSWADKWTLK